MDFKKENGIYIEGSFQDLGIKVNDNTFSISLYDKEDIFLLSLLKWRRNIPFKIFYLEFRTKDVRVARTTCTCN